MENRDIKKRFIEEISNLLSNEGYEYIKSKSMFKKRTDDNVYIIYIYFYCRAKYVEIETTFYYDNMNVHKLQKLITNDNQPDPICGGTPRFICEYYFKQKYFSEYTNLIYMKSNPIESTIQDWANIYNMYIKPFFNECISSTTLNDIVNNENINITGLNLSYYNRLLKSMIIAKQSGYTIEELKLLANKYAPQVAKVSASIRKKFNLIKDYFFSLPQ